MASGDISVVPQWQALRRHKTLRSLPPSIPSLPPKASLTSSTSVLTVILLKLMPMSTMTALSSGSSPSRVSDGLPFPRNMSDFEVETPVKMHSSPQKIRRRRVSSDYDSEVVYRTRIARLIAAKARPFTVSGRIPVDPSNLTLFFRSKVCLIYRFPPHEQFC